MRPGYLHRSGDSVLSPPLSLGQAQLKQGPKWLASLTAEVTGMLEKADQEVEDDGFMRESSFLLVSPSSGRQPTCVYVCVCVCVGQ